MPTLRGCSPGLVELNTWFKLLRCYVLCVVIDPIPISATQVVCASIVCPCLYYRSLMRASQIEVRQFHTRTSRRHVEGDTVISQVYLCNCCKGVGGGGIGSCNGNRCVCWEMNVSLLPVSVAWGVIRLQIPLSTVQHKLWCSEESL